MLLDKIQLDLKEALRAKEEIRVSTLRFLMAEIHNRESQKQKPLTDEEIAAVIRQQVKMRQEAMVAYQKAGRSDLFDKEEQELKILSKYLPQGIEARELEEIVKQIIRETNSSGPKDFGKVMGAVMAKVKGRVGGNEASEAVKNQLKIKN